MGLTKGIQIQEVVVMNKYYRPWYIWFSFLSLIILWADTAWCVMIVCKNRDTMNRAIVYLFKLIAVYYILPSMLLILISSIEPLRSVPNMLLHIPLIYLQGVYITYRFSIWRKENTSHLMRSKSIFNDTKS